MTLFSKKFWSSKNKNVYKVISSLETKQEGESLKMGFFAKLLVKIYVFVMWIWNSITKKIPKPEDLINLWEDIIRNYRTAPMFNKMELLRLIWKKYDYLNKHYFIYLNYWSLLWNFLEKQYKKFNEFWLSNSIDKIMNYITYYKQYFKLRHKVFWKLKWIYWWVGMLFASIIATIGMIVYTDFFFFSIWKWILPRDYFYSHMSHFRQYLFNNTYGIFAMFSNWEVNMSKDAILNVFILNMLFYIWIFLIVFLIVFIVFYVSSENNLLKIFKYNNEKNFMIWLWIKLETLKTEDKKTWYISYQNQDLWTIFLKNAVEVNNYKLINDKTKRELLKFSSLWTQGISLQSYEEKKFFSEVFRMFWIRIFEIYNLSLLWQTKFNNKYLHSKVNEWLGEFNVLWEREVDKIFSILSTSLLLASWIVIGFISLYQLMQVNDITKVIQVYYHNINK